MVGVPEMKRADLLKLPEFEALEKRYVDYCDKAQMHKRKPQPIAQCFGKFLPDLKIALNSLLSRSAAIRSKFKHVLSHHDYQVSEQILNDMSTLDFSNLYKELVTTRSFMASELLTHLMDTPFVLASDSPPTLSALVLQASTAFRERLDACPTNTVRKCTDIQFRDAFIKMVLGNDERHLADFLQCITWDEAAGAMMDMEGTAQGVTFMKKVLRKGKDGQPAASTQAQGGRDKKPSSDGTDWEKMFRELSQEIEANETEMRGHTQTYKDRVKRLLSLRDSRAREAFLTSLEKGGGHSGSQQRTDGGRARNFNTPQDSGQQRGSSYPQSSGGQFRSHSPRRAQDHRNFEGPAPSTYNQRHQDRGQHHDSGRNQQFDERHQQQRDVNFNSDRSPAPSPGYREQSPRPSESRQGDQQQQNQGGAPRAATSHPPSRSQVAPPDSASNRCYNCGGEGHLARQCPKIGGDGGRGGRTGNASRSPSRSA
jgi:hypothetical protein